MSGRPFRITSITREFSWDFICIAWLQWTIAKNAITKGPFWSKAFLVVLGSFLAVNLLTTLFMRSTFDVFPRNPEFARQLTSVLTTIAVLLFLINGSRAVRKPPFSLSIADALFLISSPLDSRILTVGIVFLRLLRWLIFCFALAVMALSTTPNQIGNDLGLGDLFLALPGLVIFGWVLVAWHLFVYVAANRFQSLGAIPWVCRALLATLIIYLAMNVRSSGNAWVALVNTGNNFPSVQWVLSPLWAYLQGTIDLWPLFLLLSIFLLLLSTLALIPVPIEPLTRTAFAIDSLTEQISTGEIGTLMADQLPRNPVTSFKPLIFLQGSSAFIWKQIAELSRPNGQYKYISSPIYLFMATIVLLYMWPQLFYVPLLLTLPLSIAFASYEGFSQERTSPYWYLVPGTARKKIVLASILPAMFLLLNFIALWIPTAYFSALPWTLLFGTAILLPFLAFVAQMIGAWAHSVLTAGIISNYMLFMFLFGVPFVASALVSFGLMWYFYELGFSSAGMLLAVGLLVGSCFLFLSLSVRHAEI